MEHGGKMDHPVFGKKRAMIGSVVMSVWSSSMASMVWQSKIKLIDGHILNTTKNTISPYCSILMYQFARVPVLIACTK